MTVTAAAGTRSTWWKVATATMVAVMIVGFFRGHASGTSPSSLGDTAPPACSASQSQVPATSETTLSVDTRADWTPITLSVVAEVPSQWWEAVVLRAPRVNGSTRQMALDCLFGLGYFDDVDAVTSEGKTRIEGKDEEVFLYSTQECVGAWRIELGYRRLWLSPSEAIRCRPRASLASAPATTVTARVIATHGVPRVFPPPFRESGDVHEWSWRGGFEPPDLNVEVPLSLASYAYISGPDRVKLATIDDTSLQASRWALAGATSTFITLLFATIVFLAVTMRLRTPFPLAAFAVVALLLLGVTFELENPKWPFSFTDAWMPVATLGVAASVVTSGRLRAAIVAVTAILCAGLPVAAHMASNDFDRFPAVMLAAAVATVSFSGIVVTQEWRWITTSIPQSQESWFPWPVAQGVLATLVAGSVAYSVAWGIGNSVKAGRWYAISGRLGDDMPHLAYAYVIPVLAATGFLVILRSWGGTLRPALLAGLAISWALVASPPGLFLFGGGAPVGLLVLVAALLIGVRRREPDEMLTSEVKASGLANTETSRRLLSHGPTDQWTGNLRAAVEVAAVIAVVPVTFFAWASLDTLPIRTEFGVNAAFLVGSLIREAARWVATATVFGLLYRYLPGRIGPLKGLFLSGVWFGAAAVSELINRWAGSDSGRVWTFPALQVVLFLVVLSLVYDYMTIRAAGGTWADLQTAYGIERTRTAVTYAIPAALAVLAIAQQVASGTGLEFVRGVLEGLPTVTALGR